MIAAAVEKWNLHKRIALLTLQAVGFSGKIIVLGFMLITAFISMWISNTASTIMMVTIAIALLKENSSNETDFIRYRTCLMLAIAYSASIGGIATLIGTPPNAILAGVLESEYGIIIGFSDWLIMAFPLSIIMLLATWFYLTHFSFRLSNSDFPGNKNVIQEELNKLGDLSNQEKKVLSVFVGVCLLWLFRSLIEIPLLQGLNDSTIAISGALILFILPDKQGGSLLDWKTASTIPWDILILFGGGFALAKGFSDAGLTIHIADQLTYLRKDNLFMVVLCVTGLVIFLTEITSNTATATILLPIIGAFAIAMNINPLFLMTAATIAASFAFMLPVATPPNAIVFSSRYVTIQQMVVAGFRINLLGIIIISLYMKYILPVFIE